MGIVLTDEAFGNQTTPYPSTVDGFPVGDEALGLLGQFIRAGVNRICQAIWTNETCPGRQTIDHVFYHDPKKLFEENRLPALYIWRGKHSHSRLGDDLYKITSTIEIAWIAEGAQEHHLVLRDPAMNAIAKAIESIIDYDSDPAWINTGDTGALAAVVGSSISAACGFSRIMPTEEAPQEFIFQKIEDAQPLPYYGFTMAVEVDESMTLANRTRYPSKLNATGSPNGAPSIKFVEDVQ
jgi:hypothetical protein